jgi:hypothetical protein
MHTDTGLVPTNDKLSTATDATAGAFTITVVCGERKKTMTISPGSKTELIRAAAVADFGLSGQGAENYVLLTEEGDELDL